MRLAMFCLIETPLLAAVPVGVLIPFFVFLAMYLLYLGEVYCYYRFVDWYYRSGPAVLRERWQTSSSYEEVCDAIRPLLRAEGLVGHESAAGFCIRQKTRSLNTWPRVLLRVEPSERGAVLSYEVRPFYSMALLLFPLAWLILACIGQVSFGAYVFLGAAALVFAIYKWLLPYDLKRINRVRHVRLALRVHGLHVCDHCGYDLTGIASRLCPECGHDCNGPSSPIRSGD